MGGCNDFDGCNDVGGCHDLRCLRIGSTTLSDCGVTNGMELKLLVNMETCGSSTYGLDTFVSVDSGTFDIPGDVQTECLTHSDVSLSRENSEQVL